MLRNIETYNTNQVIQDEEKSYHNILTFISASYIAYSYLILSKSNDIVNIFAINDTFFFLSIILFSTFFSHAVASILATKRKSIVHAQRKIIALRTMLGVNYSSLTFVIPNDTLHGARDPFEIKPFPGWLSIVSLPIVMVAIFLFFITYKCTVEIYLLHNLNMLESYYVVQIIPIINMLILIYTYLKKISFINSGFIVNFTIFFSKLFKISLLTNVEYVIYRARLSSYETNRLKISLDNLKTMLVFIEDKEFYQHHGVNLKGIARAIISIFKSRRVGGSSITQQIVRTLFVKDYTKVFRRKCVEIFLALWFNKFLSKDEQLELYISSVRYEKNIFGISQAMKYFFGHIKNTPSISEAFFLIERVSNINSKLLIDKIFMQAKKAFNAKILSEDNIVDIINIYIKAINEKKIIATSQEKNIFIKKLREEIYS